MVASNSFKFCERKCVKTIILFLALKLQQYFYLFMRILVANKTLFRISHKYIIYDTGLEIFR